MRPYRWILLLLVFSGVGITYAAITLRSDKGEYGPCGGAGQPACVSSAEMDANFTTLRGWLYVVATDPTWLTIPSSSLCSVATTTIPAAGGAVYWVATCTDVATDLLYIPHIRLPSGWNTGTLTVAGHALHIGASPNGEALGFDVAAQCRRHGEAQNNSWGTAQPLTIAFVTGDTNKYKSVQTGTITPNGTCSGGTDAQPLFLHLRLTVNPANFVCATASNCKLLGLDIVLNTP